MQFLSKLYDFQDADVRRMQSDFSGRVLNASEVGTGKTVQTLAYCYKYLPKYPPGPVVVVVPAHLKENWRREVLKHTGQTAYVCSRERVPVGTLPADDPNSFYVVNYDILVPDGWRSRMKLPIDSWAAWLKNLKPRMIVADEAHFAKSLQSQRTRALKKLCDGIEYVHLLTGTPLTNQPADLWPLLNILRPDVFPSQWDFLHEYSTMKHYWWGWKAVGAKNLDSLHHLLQTTVAVRRLKRDVLHDLPPVTYSTVPIECDLTEYRKAEADFIGWMRKEFPTKARSAAKAEQLSKLNYLKQLVGQLKVPAVSAMIEDYLDSTDAKLLVGLIHHSVSGPLIERFRKCSVLVNGKLSDNQKNEAFDRFNADPQCRVLFGNLQAAGTGWSCRSTSNVDIMELPWTGDHVTQFSGRVDGIGRGIAGTGASVRFYTVADTIDDDLARAVQTKQAWASEAIDGHAGINTLPVFDLVMDAMRKRCEERGEFLPL